MDPTCHRCNIIKFCILGKPNDKIGNCPMIISSDVEKEVLNLYKTDNFISMAECQAG